MLFTINSYGPQEANSFRLRYLCVAVYIEMSSFLSFCSKLAKAAYSPATAVQSQSGACASLLVNKIPPFPWIFVLILYPFSGENMENLPLNNHPFFSKRGEKPLLFDTGDWKYGAMLEKEEEGLQYEA